MTEIKNVPMSKMLKFKRFSFDHFVIWYSNLFRISDLDIRILPEHDFSFRHYLGIVTTNDRYSTYILVRKTA